MFNIHACFTARESNKPVALMTLTDSPGNHSTTSGSIMRKHRTTKREPDISSSSDASLSPQRQRRTWHGIHFSTHSRRQGSADNHTSASNQLSNDDSQSAANKKTTRSKTWHGPFHQRAHHHQQQLVTNGSREQRRRHSGEKKSIQKISRAVAQFFQNLFHHHANASSALSSSSTRNVPTRKVPGGVLLHGCCSPDEHFEKLKQFLDAIKDLHGADGLRAVGLEYRLLPCLEHLVESPEVEELADQNVDEDVCVGEEIDDSEEEPEGAIAFAEMKKLLTSDAVPISLLQTNYIPTDIHESLRSMDGSQNMEESLVTNGLCTLAQNSSTPVLDVLSQDAQPVAEQSLERFCNLCQHRLFHIESNIMVGEKNRREFIADGIMYEEVSRLCQEYAQFVMMKEGDLKWVTIEDENAADKEPVRVMISTNHPIFDPSNCRPTVLICTGRGKVRAGIFSRQHMMCNGLETATAIPLVRDAMRRRLNIVLVDPNVHGEVNGFVIYQKTMDYLNTHHFSQTGNSEGLSNRDLLILSHSASGGHMARYFLDKCESTFLKNIRGVAFTDSTHSIQWARADDKRKLFDLLQGEKSVYFRCAREGDGVAGDGNKWYLHPAGQEIQTDTFWKHRFGTIRTMWAGTNEHSLTNWFAHAKIWEHFDHRLFGKTFHSGDRCGNPSEHRSLDGSEVGRQDLSSHKQS